MPAEGQAFLHFAALLPVFFDFVAAGVQLLD